MNSQQNWFNNNNIFYAKKNIISKHISNIANANRLKRIQRINNVN